MDDLVRELKTMNQNLANLQEQVKEDKKQISKDIRSIVSRIGDIEDHLKNGRALGWNNLLESGSTQRLQPDVECGEEIPLRARRQERHTGDSLRGNYILILFF